MGFFGSLSHLLLKTVLTSLILWVVLVVYLKIPMDKVPLLLLIVFIVQTASSLAASFLLWKQRGY